MPPKTCVHCERPLGRQPVHTYPKSGAAAHLACVSQPSAADTDDLLVVIQLLRANGSWR